MLVKAKAKYIQSLGQKKHRDSEGRFIAEGPKIVSELLDAAPNYIDEVYAVKEWLKEYPSRKDFIEVTEEELEKLSQLKTPNQVVAVLRKFNNDHPIEVKGRLSLVLDTIQDPGNLGTIIRIADWFGARVKVFYAELEEWLYKQKDIPIYATALEGKDFTKMSAVAEGLIVIGNESKGIHERILAMTNERITIPRKGKAESLNAAVAVGIVLSRLAG